MNANVLVAPMDWGLGHATRCIPVIRELVDMGCTVFVGGSGSSLELLREEFPSLSFIALPPYDPEYDRTPALLRKLARQLPRMFRTIREERMLVEEIVIIYDIGLIISDNRYGCRSTRARSIFIGHQVNLVLPEGLGWIQPAINRFHRRFLQKFDRCWIPDWEGEHSLAGDMSQAKHLPAEYLGPLSRFDKAPVTGKCYEITFILSGPEPQRTLLEERVIDKVSHQNKKMCIIRGIKGRPLTIPNKNIEVYDRLNSNAISDIVGSSKLLVARSGYSTIMDMVHMGGKAVFVPTPGQPEQEYLARRLEERGIAGYVTQDAFELDSIMSKSGYRGFEGMAKNDTRLRRALRFALEGESRI